MLVYLKEPMGKTEIDGYIITGEYYNYGKLGPANVPRKVFLKNISILIEVPITDKWLSEKFNKDFPEVKFTITQMFEMDWTTLVQIARLMGIPYIDSGRKAPSKEYRKALRKSVIGKIDEV